MSTTVTYTGKARHVLKFTGVIFKKPVLVLQVEVHEKGTYESPDISPDGHFDMYPVNKKYWKTAEPNDLRYIKHEVLYE